MAKKLSKNLKKIIFKCGIVGFPLKKPRSVSIWNKYFKEKKIEARIYSFEIKKKNFDNFITRDFIQNNKFLSMLVTMPYKKEVINYANVLHQSVKNSNSSNLLIKKKNKVYAYNTDVLGAFDTIKYKLKNYKNIVVIGLGGTGQAIFSYLHNKYKNKNFTLISNTFSFKSKNVKIIKDINQDTLLNKSLIINCSPLGSNLNKKFVNQSPIKKYLFTKLNKKSLVFDIVYKPKKTKLYYFCKENHIEYINGINMNSIQAKEALRFTFDK